VSHPVNVAVVFTPPQFGPTRSDILSDGPNEKSLTKLSVCHLNPWTEPLDILVSHFFSTFLAVNDFTGRSWKSLEGHLYELLNKSPGLKNVAIALAALDRSRMPRLFSIPERHINLKDTALKSYSSSIRGLKSQLASTSDWESTVWTTFFLGIFEVIISLFNLIMLLSLITCLADARAF
jgi:hypothetical protein